MFLDKFNLDNKVALITGGSRGIGLSIAHALGEAGAKLVLTSRSDSHGATEELKKANYDYSIHHLFYMRFDLYLFQFVWSYEKLKIHSMK